MADGLLPFTAVDELGVCFDSAEEPNNVHLEAAIDGHLDPVRLRDAVLATLAADPRAAVRRARARRWDRRLVWEIACRPDVEPVEHVTWSNPGELAAIRNLVMCCAPDLDLAPPLRIAHATGPDTDLLILNAHHAALDGRSCLALLRSVAHRYAGRAPLPPDPVPARVPVGRPAAAPGYRRPARVAADRAEAAPGYGFLPLTFGLRSSITPDPIGTVNDLLLAALALAIARWNTAHGTETGTIRITMPIDARGAAETELLGNLSRLTGIVSARADLADPDRLLLATARQSTAAKMRPGAQVDAVSRALVAPWLPISAKPKLVKLARRLGSALFSDTSLLSNLGVVREPVDFGAGHPVSGLWFSTPAPMPRGLSVGAIGTRDRLGLCLRYRRALFDEPAATRFAALFTGALADLGDPRVGATVPDAS